MIEIFRVAESFKFLLGGWTEPIKTLLEIGISDF